MYVEISLLLLSMAVFLMAAFTAPLLWQVHKLVKGIQVTQQMIQQHLPKILQDLDESAGTLNVAVRTVNEQVQVVNLAMKRVQAVAGILMELESIMRIGLRLPYVGFLKNAGALVRGLRVFLDVYTSQSRRLQP